MNPIRGMRTLLGEGLRIFFFAAALYAVFAMGVWEGCWEYRRREGKRPPCPSRRFQCSGTRMR